MNGLMGIIIVYTRDTRPTTHSPHVLYTYTNYNYYQKLSGLAISRFCLISSLLLNLRSDKIDLSLI